VKKMISFIGAGPGSIEFLTVKAYKVIKNSDVVIYAGSTVSDEILSIVNHRRLFNSASMSLEEIEDVFGKYKSKNIARIHSGDTAVYSAIDEEIEIVKKLEVEYDVVPGISAYSYFASKLQIQLTSPEVAQSIVITRLEGRTKVPENIESFFKEQPSCAIYLSGSKPYEVLELLKKYYPEDAYLAIGHKLSRKDERIEVKRLKDWRYIDFPALLTLFMVYKKNNFKSKLYDKSFSHGERKGISS